MAVLIALRSGSVPAIDAFGICIAIENIASVVALIWIVQTPRRLDSPGSTPTKIGNDLRPRILLVGLCVPFALLLDAFPSITAYGLATGSAVALGIELYWYATKGAPATIDAHLRRGVLDNVFLALILLVAGHKYIAQSSSLDVNGLAAWAVSYVATVKAWGLYQSRSDRPRRTQAT